MEFFPRIMVFFGTIVVRPEIGIIGAEYMKVRATFLTHYAFGNRMGQSGPSGLPITGTFLPTRSSSLSPNGICGRFSA